MYGLRAPWRDDSECLILRKDRIRVQKVTTYGYANFNPIFGAGALRYDLIKDGRSLLNAEAIVIEGKPSKSLNNAIPTGGKTEFRGMAVHHMMPERLHPSARFDLAKARGAIRLAPEPQVLQRPLLEWHRAS
ncbi:MAG: hypothetical protein RLZZ142_208 [Verrucomicrobiota bacterium]